MPSTSPLLRLDPNGLFCESGGFYIDPWQPVTRALVTHGHADHARRGCGAYLAAAPGLPILRRRIGMEAAIQGIPYGERLRLGDVTVSFHPSGHILGAAQILLERAGERWIAAGDYKRQSDPTCEGFEPIGCDTFITEATFGLPIYRWGETAEEAREVLAWWEENRAAGRASVLFCYALGKAQRVLAELAALTDRTVYVHGAVEPLAECYRQEGVRMLPTRRVAETVRGHSFAGELVLAPTSAAGSTWMRRFGDASTGFVSGWMLVRGARRRRGFDRGFVISDHADWPALLQTIRESGARRVLTTHGFTDSLSRYLREQGIESQMLSTPYGDEEDPEAAATSGAGSAES
jgi:putative mRNA 3-end processing factor